VSHIESCSKFYYLKVGYENVRGGYDSSIVFNGIEIKHEPDEVETVEGFLDLEDYCNYDEMIEENIPIRHPLEKQESSNTWIAYVLVGLGLGVLIVVILFVIYNRLLSSEEQE